MFRQLEENKQAELSYCIELTNNLEEPTKSLVQNTFQKNITGMSKNEKNYYMTRITELILSSVVIAVNIVPLELFAAFKLPMILLDARIWTILFCVCILFCIALDSLFQFRGTWQQQKELVQELKNECLKYSYKLGAYAKNTDQMERKVMFLQRFLEMTGEKYSLFEYHKTQEQKDEMKKQELQEVEKQEVA